MPELRKLIACLKENNNFLITSHLNPEGDALGSEIACYRLLKAMGKDALILNDDNTPPGYAFLPGVNKIKKFNKKNIRKLKFDCLVVLDCSGLKRCGQVAELNSLNRPVINIDHHISNEFFGGVNWVDTHASSCSEMVYSLYKKLRLPINKQTAILLYVGMLTDTGSFRYTNTTGLTHKAVSELIGYGVDVALIHRSLYQDIPFQDMKLISRILPGIQRSFAGKVAWFQIRQQLLENRNVTVDLTDYMLGFARSIKDVEVALLFKENLKEKDEIRVNFRSQGRVDVNKVARFFGGGGHKTASGATIRGKINTVRKKVLAKIKESL